METQEVTAYEMMLLMERITYLLNICKEIHLLISYMHLLLNLSFKTNTGNICAEHLELCGDV